MEQLKQFWKKQDGTNRVILVTGLAADHLTCLLRNVYAGQEVTELDNHWTGCKLGEEYIKAVYFNPAYLTYMKSTS